VWDGGMVKLYHAVHRSQNGKTLRVCLSVEEGKIVQAVFTGDFFAEPSESLIRLGEALKGVNLRREDLEKAVSSFLRRERVWLLGVEPKDFVEVILKAGKV